LIQFGFFLKLLQNHLRVANEIAYVNDSITLASTNGFFSKVSNGYVGKVELFEDMAGSIAFV
jgi:hypothetical protein